MTHSVPAGAPLHGAIDLSTLGKQPPVAADSPSAVVLELTEANIQEVAQRSGQVPVIINLGSSASPASEDLTQRITALANEYAGAFLLANCDIDAQRSIAQAFNIQAVPTVMALIGGRPAPLFQGNAPDEQLREVLDQVLAVSREAGITGSVTGVDPAAEAGDDAPPPEPLPPLHQAAFDAIERDDLDGAIASYEQALTENPRDYDARAGLAQVRLMQRVTAVDPRAARAAAAADPSDIDAQLVVADLDVSGGMVDDRIREEEFRLADPVRRDRDHVNGRSEGTAAR